jgi:hypothetical protein
VEHLLNCALLSLFALIKIQVGAITLLVLGVLFCLIGVTVTLVEAFGGGGDDDTDLSLICNRSALDS